MTDYVDSMKIDDVLYEIHDTYVRTELPNKMNKSSSMPDDASFGMDETGQFFIEV